MSNNLFRGISAEIKGANAVISFVPPLGLALPTGVQTHKTTSARCFIVGYNCVEQCQKRNRKEVKPSNILYSPDSQSAKHRECMDKAKTKFDARIGACK
jgi:hypothetical protein